VRSRISETCPPAEGEYGYRYVVPPSASRKQIDRLGRRIAESGVVDGGDRALFADVLDYYQELLDVVCTPLTAMGLIPTSRVKTTGTLTEKLQRDHGMQLSRIQDISGARVVLDGDRSDQDALVRDICTLYAEFPRAPEIIDRRASPRQGYRAVHVIVYPEGFPVEIQVRTDLQDIWAQIFERIADKWGRQIRYGEPPSPPSPEGKTADEYREAAELRPKTVTLLTRISDQIDEVERRRTQARQVRNQVEKAILSDLRYRSGVLADLTEVEATSYVELRGTSIRALKMLEKDKRKRSRIIRRSLPRDRIRAEELRKTMKFVGSLLSDDMLRLIELTHHQEDLLRKALDHVSQIPEDG
jgi:ppGpp synthetase/RelA/SpoT-type nucleotidyltranferase